MSKSSSIRQLTPPAIKARKGTEPIICLTSYTASMTTLVDPHVRFARPAGSSWRVDETYVKIRGKSVYLCRAVDRDGRTVDFRLSAMRAVGAARAIESQGAAPQTITLDGFAASHRAVR
jgi:transposase-like protein